jgi:hypothetical protein
MQEIIKSLKERSINGYFVSNKDEALKEALALIPSGSKVGFGGSVTLEQIGILDILRKQNNIKLLDRTKVSQEEKVKLYTDMFSADIFLSGSNALTKDGKIINVDGIGNRVAAITYGPRKVIIIVGRNKIVEDQNAALDRIKNVAVKKNIERMKKKGITEWSEETMWGQIGIIERQRDINRMHVIIVDEELGY